MGVVCVCGGGGGTAWGDGGGEGGAHSQQSLYFCDMGFFLLSAYITQGHRLSQQWNSVSARSLRAANER